MTSVVVWDTERDAEPEGVADADADAEADACGWDAVLVDGTGAGRCKRV